MTNYPDKVDMEDEEGGKVLQLINSLSALTINKQQPRGVCYIRPVAVRL